MLSSIDTLRALKEKDYAYQFMLHDQTLEQHKKQDIFALYNDALVNNSREILSDKGQTYKDTIKEFLEWQQSLF